MSKDNICYFPNKYNILFYSNILNKSFLFNTTTNNIYELEEDEYNKLKEITKTKKYKKINQKELQSYIDEKILVKDETIEYLNFKLILQSDRYRNEKITIGININQENAHAKDKHAEMNIDIALNLIQFIQLHKNINKISIWWLGDNPLLSSKIIYFITKEIIKTLKKKVENTIVISGETLKVEEIRNLKDLYMQNIYIVFNIEKQMINVWEEKIKSLEKHLSIMEMDTYKINFCLTEPLRTSQNYTIFKKLLSLARKYNIKPIILKSSFKGCWSDIYLKKTITAYNLNSLPTKLNEECIARNIHSFILDRKGNIYKCWLDVNFPEKSIGNIIDRFNQNIERYTKYLAQEDPFDNIKCQDCSSLLICGGPCPHYSINKLKSRNCNEIYDSIIQSIEKYYLYEYSKQG